MGSRVELFAAIRFDWQCSGSSIRALADKYGVHRRTVRQAIESVVPPQRRSTHRATPVLNQVRGWIDEMLRQDLDAPRKQRHTARRIFDRLVDEHDASVSYSYVAKYMNRRRPQIVAEARDRAGVVDGFVPQTHEPGAEAEVDFADLWVYLADELTKCFLFTLRLSCSGRGVHRVFRTQGQEAFLEGHEYAFERIGGVPYRHIRYDNGSAGDGRGPGGRSQPTRARRHYRTSRRRSSAVPDTGRPTSGSSRTPGSRPPTVLAPTRRGRFRCQSAPGWRPPPARAPPRTPASSPR